MRWRSGDCSRESGCGNMHTLMRITLLCVFVLAGVTAVRGATQDSRGVTQASESGVRSVIAGSGSLAAGGAVAGSGASRDSALLLLAAARRKQLFKERLTQHALLAAKLKLGNSTLLTPTTNQTIASNVTSGASNSATSEAKTDYETSTKFYPNVNKLDKNTSNTLHRTQNLSSQMIVEKNKVESEADPDNDEEFQVDESSHGVYLLNYTDTNTTTAAVLIPTDNADVGDNIVPNTTTDTKPSRTTISGEQKISKENENRTLFMSEDIYNHFRPLESELREEDVAQFMFFGKKLGVNGTAPAPLTRDTYTSRYSAAERVRAHPARPRSDLALSDNAIEKNEIRSATRGPVPARHISLLNAYRKPLNATLADVATPKPFFRNTTRSRGLARRRPLRPTSPSFAKRISFAATNSTQIPEGSTASYTAVVTSVSITSSVKSQNKTRASEDIETETGDPSSPALNNSNSVQKDLASETLKDIAVSPQQSSMSSEQTPILENLATNHQLIDHIGDLSSGKPENNFSMIQDKDQSISLDGILTIEPSESRAAVSHPQTIRPVTNVTVTTATPSAVVSPITQAAASKLPNLFEPSSVTVNQPSSPSTPAYSLPSKDDDRFKSADETDGRPNATTGPIESEDGEVVRANEEVVVSFERGQAASYVLAGLGLLPVAAAVAFALRHLLSRRGKQLDAQYDGYSDCDEPGKNTSVPPLRPAPTLNTAPKPDHKWEFPRDKLRLQTLLGEGNFGQVWKAEADDLNGHDGLTRLVAVKTVKPEASAQDKQDLLHEICIMHKIGTHPNVVTLLACCTQQEPYLLVMEYVMCGKLLTYLRERRLRPPRAALSSRDLTVFAYCVARGMDYLASKKVVHRDLAARNILVDHNKLCKIADFGMSREVEETRGAEGGPGAGGCARRHALPVRWMAPEALLYNVCSYETDVWAFGILLWEIVTLGCTPYAALSAREVARLVSGGYRLERPPHCKPALYRTMHACWHASPSHRPDFAHLKTTLADLLDREPAEGHYVDLDSFYRDSSVYSDASAILPDDADHTPPRRRRDRDPARRTELECHI